MPEALPAGTSRQADRVPARLGGQAIAEARTMLVGRDRDFAELAAALADVPKLRGGSLLVRGAPGIGKSVLLDAVTGWWEERGGRTLRSAGTESEMRLPFAALHRLLRPVMSHTSGLTRSQQDTLARAFAVVDAPAPQMFRVAHAALDLVAEVAGEQPLLLVTDDTQWLDPASAEVLSFIARRLSSDPVFLLAAARAAHPNPVGEACDRHMTLDPLDDRHAEKLLALNDPEVPPRTRVAILTAAAGNPLALVELPKVMDADTLDRSPPGLVPMTERLQRAFELRAAHLTGLANDLLLLIALNDDDSLAEILDAAARLQGEEVQVDAMGPAVAAGLIELGWQTVRFRHPLMRSAIYRAASRGRVQRAHAALAEALRDDPDRRAWHRAEATLGTDEQVAQELADAAGRAMRRGAIADAVAAWQRAAVLSVSTSRRASRLLRAAELAADLGDPSLSGRLDDQLTRWELGHRDRLRLEWVRERTHPEMLGGQPRVRALLDLAEDADADGDSDLGADFLMRAGLRCWSSSWGAQASEQVIRVSDRLQLARVDPRLVVTRAYAAPFSSGSETIEIVSDPGVLASVDHAGMHLLGHAAACVGAFAQAQELLSGAVEGLREEGRVALLVQALRILTWAALRRGRWDIAEPAAEEVQRLATETRQSLYLADMFAARATLACLRGRLDDADACAADAERLSVRSRYAVTLATVQNARALRAAAAGAPELAFDELYRVYQASDPAYHPMQGCWAIGSLAEYAVRSGRADLARAELARLEPLAALTPAPRVHIGIRHAQALLAGDGEAEAQFEAALDPRLGDWPLEKARISLAYGARLRRMKRITDSRRPLRTARDVFDRLGVTDLAERARQELRASGESSPRRAPDAWDRLTPQELQIAQMVAEGLSNKEIGQRLYLSHRTIASHLYATFPKLGVSTRAQLAQVVRNRPSVTEEPQDAAR